jgi:hypothetical protein
MSLPIAGVKVSDHSINRFSRIFILIVQIDTKNEKRLIALTQIGP